MKKAKIMLAAVLALGIVGGAFAFKNDSITIYGCNPTSLKCEQSQVLSGLSLVSGTRIVTITTFTADPTALTCQNNGDPDCVKTYTVFENQ